MKNGVMVTYTKDNTKVYIKSDDTFTIVGEDIVKDEELLKMNNWEEVNGWVAK